MKKPQTWVAISIILIMLGSVLANFFNTSAYNVQVTEISFATEAGVLNGLLYMPDGANASDPRPTIITTHGYLNAKEMQDAPAIEMSRRGYVVLALDMYEHGDSYLNSVPLSNPFFAFWTTAMNDAVQYMYNQPYVLKDELGNGIIGVSGHSMGGFSSTMAAVMDEQAYQKNLAEGTTAVRKILAVLTTGSDFRWSSYLGVTAEAYNMSLANRSAGAIAGQYDEFFFSASAYESGNTIIEKNYAQTPDGQTFLGNPDNAKDNVFYGTSAGGKRIIFQPKETHPWNHFSLTTTGYQILFYSTAFEQYAPKTDIPQDSQIWLLKEYAEFIALIGFFMLFVPLIQLLLKIPHLSTVTSQQATEFSGPTTRKTKVIFWILIAFSSLFPAIFYPTLMGKLPKGLTQLKVAVLIVFIVAIILAFVTFLRQKDSKVYLGWSITALGAFISYGLTIGSGNLFNLSTYFNEPQTNAVVYWALYVGVITFVILTIVYHTVNSSAVLNMAQYGVNLHWKNILKAFLTAAIAASVGFILLFIVDWLFKTDFRLWLVAVRAFNKNHFMSALRYMPFFFIFYLVNGISLQINTNSNYMKGAKGYLLAYVMNIGGLVLFLILQYGKLFITNTAAFPSVSLNSIVLLGFVVILLISTYLTKKLLDKTHNVYTGAFLNTIVLTLMTIASSTMYVNLM